MTTAYRAVGGAASATNPRSRLPWELSAPAATYGDLAVALRAAYDLGYVIAFDDTDTATHLRADVVMDALLPLEPYLQYFDHLVLPMFSSDGAGGTCAALWNLVTGAVEMVPGSSGSGTLTTDSDVPILDLSVGNGRGMFCEMDPTVFNVTAAGKCMFLVSKHTARPPSSSPHFARVVQGTNTYLSIGANTTSGKWRAAGVRRISGTLREQIVESSADTVLSTWAIQRLTALYGAGGTLALHVGGAEVIPPTTWYSTDAGLLDLTVIPQIQIAVPGASHTKYVQVALHGITNTADPTTIAAIEAAIATVMDAILP